MRRWISIIIILSFCFSVKAQENLFRIAENYFRINPFNRPYNKFFTDLVNDPLITSKSLKRKTDTTLFYFAAQYKDYSPYTSFKSDRTEIRLMEKAVDIGDSTEMIDTMFIYQLISYKSGPEGLEGVKKEFTKFNRKFKGDFFTDDHSDLLKGDEVVGGMVNYFVFTCQTSPLNVSWWKNGSDETAFSISFRFKISENMPVLPIPPDRRQ